MQKHFLLLPAACLLLVGIGLYVQRDQLAYPARPEFLNPIAHGQEHAPPSASKTTSSDPVTVTTATFLAEVTRAAYVKAIMNPDATDLPRMECPKLDSSRYQQLQETGGDQGIRYFFALDLRQCLAILPRLLGSVVEAIRFLGPEKCALSIVEGNSDDGTSEVLAALRPELEALGLTYHFNTSPINPKKGNRIKALAALRNLALQPLLDRYYTNPKQSSPPPPPTPPPTVIFLNDVAICPEDILELAHQRRALGADMVCAMDWTYVGQDPTFYDVWVARGLTGDSFFEIPPDGSWDLAWNLFWNDAGARARLAARRPFQVFSCWNGAAVFSAAPLVDKPPVRFRAPREGECSQGEPQLFCKDLWFHGYRKIAVVPAANLAYSDDAGRRIKEAKGYASTWVGAPGWEDEPVEWRNDPPEGVKCIPAYDKQFFEAWNKTQPGT
ncbi:glycosyltransferase family 69 protein [Thermothelomyces heterothallicus CBS 202.75]|uniref:glycosyltransferase family 69 protein n=1 Tax=Thermothelomyces heterothallicus CBS 202.75 TaxID=1149848 RepID=UPI003743A240